MKSFLPQTDRVLVEYTSGSLRGEDAMDKILRAQSVCSESGFRFGVQIHNAAPLAQIEWLAGLDIPLSVHAPLLSEYFINLAMEDPGPSMQSVEATVRWMRELHADIGVFHGFVMTDHAVKAFNEQRSWNDCMAEAHRPELGREGTSMCGDFLETQEYRLRHERVKSRLAALRRRYPALTLAIENDFPQYGTGFITSESGTGFMHPLCIDTGHLWTSAGLLGRDFHEEANTLLATGQVQLVHLHASSYTADTPTLKWRDGHKPLTIPNAMDLGRFVAACRRAGVCHYTLEIKNVSETDIRRFGEFWYAGERAAQA